VDAELLERLLAHPFLARPWPRSTGRELFGAAFVRELLREGGERGLAHEDLLATAAAFTAEAAARALAAWAPGGGGTLGGAARAFPRVHVSGGGAENPVLVARLAAAIAPVELRPFGELGIPSRAREAVSFAVLAGECLARSPANLPQVTGAARAAVLGEIAWGTAG
jgi:anhydro-N-acetylmuramic acid kinase